MNNALPPYFDVMKPVLPRIDNLYEIRKPSFHLPKIRHEFAEHLIEYCLINNLNKEEDSISITTKVFTFWSFKFDLKMKVITKVPLIYFTQNTIVRHNLMVCIQVE